MEKSIRAKVRLALKKQFAQHVKQGGSWWDFLDPTKNGVGNLYNSIKHEVVDPDSDLRSKIIPDVIDTVKTVAPLVAGLGMSGGRAPSPHALATKAYYNKHKKEGITFGEASHQVSVQGLAKPKKSRKSK